MWRSRLDIGAEDLVSRRCTLNDDELGRAGRFVKASDRDRFVAARGLLREVVGAYVGLTPSAVEFEYGPNGKPHLAGGAPGLGFNLSHSGDWALCAVARSNWVGVDVELIRTDIDMGELTGVLTSRERETIETLAFPDRIDAFFELWTRKEAVAKALGVGLSEPLEHFEVGATGQDVILGAHRRAPAAPRWWLAHSSPAPGYAGAVAVQGGRWRLSLWNARSRTSTAPVTSAAY